MADTVHLELMDAIVVEERVPSNPQFTTRLSPMPLLRGFPYEGLVVPKAITGTVEKRHTQIIEESYEWLRQTLDVHRQKLTPKIYDLWQTNNDKAFCAVVVVYAPNVQMQPPVFFDNTLLKRAAMVKWLAPYASVLSLRT